jgi:uncharacterized protein YbjT (DUF2867 family)
MVPGDVTRPETLRPALQGVSAAYYLVHSMASGRNYTERELDGARNFAAAAARAGLEHIIYLGGLADPGAELAPHMRSRIQTGEGLRQGHTAVTEFRAGVIVGPGSISFEMVRYLGEQFPVLIGPPWLRNRSQPVAAGNVIDYLLATLDTPAARGGVYEIGGTDVLTYAETILTYARLRGLRRRLFILPYIPVGFMAWWVDRLTPVPKSIARPLIEGLSSDSVVRDDRARRDFPHIHPLDYRTAVQVALAQLEPARIEPVWKDGGRLAVTVKHEGFFVDCRRARLQAEAPQVFQAVCAMGGRNGWPYANWLWQARGLLDRLAGGPGMRGRRHAERLQPGEIVDFYRVEAFEPGCSLRLRSELKAPGQGWMEWRLEMEAEAAWLVQTAYFAPRGLPGFLYWRLLRPLHVLVFRGLLKNLARGGRTGTKGAGRIDVSSKRV